LETILVNSSKVVVMGIEMGGSWMGGMVETMAFPPLAPAPAPAPTLPRTVGDAVEVEVSYGVVVGAVRMAETEGGRYTGAGVGCGRGVGPAVVGGKDTPPYKYSAKSVHVEADKAVFAVSQFKVTATLAPGALHKAQEEHVVVGTVAVELRATH